MKTVGADLHIRPNALRLYKQSIHPFRLWKPKPNGAERVDLCEDSTYSKLTPAYV